MELKKYQEKAVDKLYHEIVDQLDASGQRRKIVFQAPTGAGKTVMATEVMSRLHQYLRDEDCQYKRVAFVWLAPNALHIQSYLKMKSAFSETRILEPVLYDDLDLSCDGYIHPGQVLFVNWQSINKAKNVMVRGSEQTRSIYEIFASTRSQHIAIVCIIDEEHMFAGKNATKSEAVLGFMQPKVEVRISATPVTTDNDAKISVTRQDVISAGMIKQNISLNPAMHHALSTENDELLNGILLKEALHKRQQIAEAYQRLGVDINPLLLIQLPNDDSETLSREENDLKDTLLQNLNVNFGINQDNNKLAIWLADQKTDNLKGIEEPNSMVEVLLFKQAIALGWDCPRAAVLLIFRKLSSFTFTIQTVGRIMRMPQQHFYGNSLLDIGYVYTDLSADRIRVEPDDAKYINVLHSIRRENLQNVTLTSSKEERSNKENNILRADFRKFFRKKMAEEWTLNIQTELLFDTDNFMQTETIESVQERNKQRAKIGQRINFDVARIQIDIPTDMELQDEEGEYTIENHVGYARTMDELQQVYDKFCGSLLGGWSKSKALPLLEDTLTSTMETLFGIDEFTTIKVVLYHDNQAKFRDIISRSLDVYKRTMMEKIYAKDKGFQSVDWSIPEVRDYSDATFNERKGTKNHALLPFYEINGVKTPEFKFTKFLEDNSAYIDWWYKNGDNGAEHFAVKYINSEGKERLFYVDYIIRMKNGSLCLFDTKSMGGDSETIHKHNALIDYLANESGKRNMHIDGGIIIWENGDWKYSPMYINNANDLSGWSTFMPDHYN